MHTVAEFDTALHGDALSQQAVYDVVTKAQAVLPEELTGRITKAEALVLAGHVDMLSDGTARVHSQCKGAVLYHIVNGHCDCPDYERAPQNWCKHRLAHAITKRATALAKDRSAAAALPALDASLTLDLDQDVLAEGIVTSPTIPPQHVVTIQGKPFVRFAGLLAMALERGLVSLTATWTSNDSELSLAHAVAVFQDGRRFEECGDATPANVTKKGG